MKKKPTVPKRRDSLDRLIARNTERNKREALRRVFGVPEKAPPPPGEKPR